MKNLKKFFGSFLVMAVCAMFAVSCGTPTVQELVEATNKTCPQKMTEVMSLKSVTLQDKDVVFTVEVAEPNASQMVVTDEVIEATTEQMRKTYKEGTDALSMGIKEGGFNVVYVFEGAEAGVLYEVVVENSTLK